VAQNHHRKILPTECDFQFRRKNTEGIIQNLSFGLVEVDQDERINLYHDAMCDNHGICLEENWCESCFRKSFTNAEMRAEIQKSSMSLEKKNKSSVYEAQKSLQKAVWHRAIYAFDFRCSYLRFQLEIKLAPLGIPGISQVVTKKGNRNYLEASNFFLQSISFVTRLLEVDYRCAGVASEMRIFHIVNSLALIIQKFDILNEDKQIARIEGKSLTQDLGLHRNSGKAYKFGEGVLLAQWRILWQPETLKTLL